MIKVRTYGTGVSIVLVPGGPGLSSQTLKALEPLSYHFKLHFVDFPGTNSNPYQGSKSFEEICHSLAEYINNLREKDVFILGHSYGGFIGAKTSILVNPSGLICLSTPFTSQTLEQANANYIRNLNTRLLKAEKAFYMDRSDESFKEWIFLFGELYFSDSDLEEGRRLLKEDKSSAQFYLDNGSDIEKHSSLIHEIANWSGPKMFIAGKKTDFCPLKI